ncbi:holo-ACP synthase [Patescibacteria group bacterium]|nr:holo-ACP synthase [Patescibacteria group bacterium]
MNIVSGIDMVYIEEFGEQLKLSEDNFVKRCFTTKEQNIKETKTLAGIFAVKESVIKAYSLAPGSWLNIEVDNRNSGKPYVTIKNIDEKVLSQDVSISHSKDYVIASYTALIE